MSNKLKKRRRSCQESEENQLDAKRIKIESESVLSVDEELSEQHSVKNKKKHKHHRSEINEETVNVEAETPDQLHNDGYNVNRLLEDGFESGRSAKKHKHHRHHHKDDTVIESVDTSVRYEQIVENTAGTESKNRLHQLAAETSSSHKKKKKKQRHREDENCHTESEIVLKKEIDTPTDGSHIIDAADSIVLESLAVSELGTDISAAQDLDCETGKKKKKKKKKHHSQDCVDESENTVNTVKYEDVESELPLSGNGTSWSSQGKSVSTQRQAETSCMLPAGQDIHEGHRPLQLHINTEEIRFNAGEEFKEFQPEDHSDGIWWEDVATNPNLEMWLVRAPLDFSASCVEGTRGMLYDSVLVPQPGRPGEGFQISIQAVQQSKLVVLLPSKQDKKLHVASDVNGYVTITRSQFARTDVDLEPPAAESEFDTDKKRKKNKHKSKETSQETACQVSRKKHKDRQSD